MLDFVTFKWKAKQFYRSTFTGDHVNNLAAMIRRDYQKPHRFSCITDDEKGIDKSRVRIIPLWTDLANVPSAYGQRNPSCYRRLKLFSPEMRELIGERIVSMDLDMVTTGDLVPLFDRPEDIVLIKSATTSPRYRYNGSMLMMTAGVRPYIWKDFDPIKSPRETVTRGFFGSDQAWLSMKLPKNEATWDEKDGVYSYRMHLLPKGSILPDNAKVIAFHGEHDPWGKHAQQLEWVRRYYANWKTE